MKGIKIASRGKDTKKAQPKDLVLGTELFTLPIYRQFAFNGFIRTGQFYDGSNFGSVIIDIPHNLGFAPLFAAWVALINTNVDPWERMSSLKQMPCFTGGSNGTGSGSGFRISADIKAYADKIRITFGAADTPLTTTPDADVPVSGYVFIFSNDWRSFPNG